MTLTGLLPGDRALLGLFASARCRSAAEPDAGPAEAESEDADAGSFVRVEAVGVLLRCLRVSRSRRLAADTVAVRV